MWQELFVNACILITFIFVASLIYNKIGLSIISTIKKKVILGVMGGLSSSILIYFSIPVTSQVILDYREICVILVSIFGGILPAIITGSITLVFRLLYSSVNETSYIVAIAILVICIGCGLLSYTNFSYKLKCWVMLLYCLVIKSIVYVTIIPDKISAGIVILEMWVATTVLAAGVFYIVIYQINSFQILRELKQESTHDYLTGLRNTRSFHKKYNAILDYTILNHGTLSILIIDIDHYKTVNDSFGHVSGDMVLKELGKLLKTIARDSYLVSRIGGEEFAVILKDDTREKTLELAERIRTTIATHKFAIQGGKKIRITVSIGVAIYPETVLEKLMDEADQKLFEAKNTGRNKVCI